MSHRRILAPLAFAALATATLLSGCLSKTAVEPIRYFRPEPPPDRAAARAPARAPSPVWLRRVTAASHLHELMARRTSDVEIGFNDLERWTSPPASFVERALAVELFEALGVERSESARSPRLDVDVLAFEERMAPRHVATVALAVSLLDGRELSILERTFTADSPVDSRPVDSSAGDSSEPAAVARAMGIALDQAVRAAAAAIVEALPAAKQ
jgi:ABC-type uncharacterized transport system auxiliary subunit